MRAVRWTLFAMLALIAVGVAAMAARRDAGPPQCSIPPSPPQVVVGNKAGWTGSPACIGRSCHGGLEPRGGVCQQDEYTTISSRDPHARAYRVLFSEPSQTMARLLGRTDGKAHEMSRCLACHASPLVLDAAAPRTLVQAELGFGVGCESCHGPAGGWIDLHYLPGRAKPETTPNYVNLSDSSTRAATCAGCHVGSTTGERFVDHDLIAAGHPRLLFEFVSLESAMPAHWRTRRTDPCFDWFVGQVEGAKASLAVLKGQVQRSVPWPEFAEYDCFACHHDLAPKAWRQRLSRSRRPGTLTWNSWTTSVVERLFEVQGLSTKDWTALRETMETLAPPETGGLIEQIERASRSLTDLSRKADHWRGPLGQMKMFLQLPDWRDADSWEAAEQFFFALSAYYRATGDEATSRRLRELDARRGFEPGFTSPRRFDPNQFFPKK